MRRPPGEIIVGMNRRSTALSVAAVCLVALFGVAFLAPMPYVVMSPGVTENTLGAVQGHPVVIIKGHRTYPTDGHLNLTTVSVTSADFSVRLPQVLNAWWSRDQIVLPRDVIYPPDQSVKQVQQQNTQEMVDSQSAAVVAGLQAAGIDTFHVQVVSVEDGAPAAGALRAGDVIRSVNGAPVASSTALVDAISALQPGSRVRLGIVRGGSPQTVTVTTQPSSDDPQQSRIGIRVQDVPPFTVDIRLGQEIGGPSAGLMFSLAIYDKLTPGALTGGRFIAGTGTITVDGQVGEIGGIQQKIIGAYDAGARYFLVPAGNCAEATGASVAGKIDLIRVTSLAVAVHALNALRTGDTAAVPTCRG
jgi:PDZ domain-containing protein